MLLLLDVFMREVALLIVSARFGCQLAYFSFVSAASGRGGLERKEEDVEGTYLENNLAQWS